MNENGRITTNNKRGLAHVKIERKEKSNRPFIPVILNIYVVEFYSIFVEKSFQLIDIEVGKQEEFKIYLQHEFGLLFAESKFSKLNHILYYYYFRI